MSEIATFQWFRSLYVLWKWNHCSFTVRIGNVINKFELTFVMEFGLFSTSLHLPFHFVCPRNRNGHLLPHTTTDQGKCSLYAVRSILTKLSVRFMLWEAFSLCCDCFQHLLLMLMHCWLLGIWWFFSQIFSHVRCYFHFVLFTSIHVLFLKFMALLFSHVRLTWRHVLINK